MDNDQLLEQKSTDELIAVMLREIAKSSSEIKCAEADIKKASSRLSFAVLLLNVLISRRNDERDDYK